MFFPMLLRGWPRADRRLRPLVAVGCSLLALAGLLVSFQGVVREAVHQGELRREATARHSAAMWRCTGLRSLSQRDLCLAQLNARPPEETLLPAVPGYARADASAMTQGNSPH